MDTKNAQGKPYVKKEMFHGQKGRLGGEETTPPNPRRPYLGAPMGSTSLPKAGLMSSAAMRYQAVKAVQMPSQPAK